MARAQSDSHIALTISTIRVLGRLGSARDSVALRRQAAEVLVLALEESDGAIREAAVAALIELGETQIIGKLISRLINPNPAVQVATAQALLALGWQPGNDRQQARLALIERDWDRLAKLGEATVNLLIVELKNSAWPPADREAMLITLAQLGRQPDPITRAKIVGGLSYLLGQKEAGLHRLAVQTLLHMGRQPIDGPLRARIIHTLLEAVEAAEAEPGRMLAALIQLGRVDPDPLALALIDGSPARREAAVYVLGQIGHRRSVEPVIAVLEHDSTAAVRYAAARALGNIGRQIQDEIVRGWLIEALRRAVNASDPQLGQQAEAALEKIVA